MKILLFLITLLATTQLTAEPYNSQVNLQPETVHKIKLDTDDTLQYKKLAMSVGLEYGVTYGYRDFATQKQINEIGTAGNYEFLLLSTGGNAWNAEDDIRAVKTFLHWEMTYYSNHDITIIYAIKSINDRSYVRLMKLGKGRITDLHLR